MTKLSVNVNKFATLRNARGGSNPDLIRTVRDCERFGADGITIHPRPDERHITYRDVFELQEVVATELNIEGYPDDRFLHIIEKARPAQATLVPDAPDVLTSNAGWDTIKNAGFLKGIINNIRDMGVRISVFTDPTEEMVEGAHAAGADRVELYTETYASRFHHNKQEAVKPFVKACEKGLALGLGINAGHDLDLQNLSFFKQNLPEISEVSIGHALICDAIYYGLENIIPMYKRQLQ